jgi:hypothetical protein
MYYKTEFTMQSMSLRLPEPLFHQLIVRAKTNAMSQTELVREAILQYLQTPAKQAAEPMNAYEAGKKWIGKFDGPADLSTNPKYMTDFGK